jgi:hypothetical protein
MSSGPDLSGGPEASADQSTGAGTVTDAAAPNAGDGASPDSEPRTYRIRIAIPRDGRGSRRVRVEYEDANGSQSPVDEDYGEGDVIRRTVEVYGGQITVRVFYGDDPQPVSERTERLSRRSR